jgi:hypothetical protein
MSVALVFLAALLLVSPSTAADYRLRVVVRDGTPSPIGGSFDHFSLEPVPVVTPMNAAGDVAFFAILARTAAREGLFLARGARTLKIAAEGDRLGPLGTITGFGKEPIPALNDQGDLAFHASLSGGSRTEGIFVGAAGRAPRAVALSGQSASGVPSGTLAGFDAPALNARGDVAFLASVQRGRDTLDAIYLASGGRLQKVAAQGDPSPVGGSFAGFGPPSLNNRGAVAFGAVVEGGRAVGGLFVVAAGQRARSLLLAGDDTPLGGVFARFGERLGLNDAGQIAFHGITNGATSPAGIFVTSGAGVTAVAAVGGARPGGGRFASFGPWPSLAGDGRVGFVGALEGGEVPVAVFLWGPSGIEQVVAVGGPSAAGPIGSFGLYPVVSMNDRGALAFSIAPTPGTRGAEAVLVADPSR